MASPYESLTNEIRQAQIDRRAARRSVKAMRRSGGHAGVERHAAESLRRQVRALAAIRRLCA